ncbi:25S rRNA (uracil2634-N3)-methyltransferase [Sarracenia purpurea var. burkii]
MEVGVLGNENKEEKRIMHYSSSHKILLVGEGDFSFAACLATAFGSAANIIATSLDSKELLSLKHPSAVANLEQLKRLGDIVLHEVDVRTMTQDTRLSSKIFDRIVFNFPHAGFDDGYREHSARRIK